MPRKKMVVLRPRAERDQAEQYAYLFLNSLETSERFIKAVESAFRKLSDFPGIGRPCDLPGILSPDLRMYRFVN